MKIADLKAWNYLFYLSDTIFNFLINVLDHPLPHKFFFRHLSLFHTVCWIGQYPIHALRSSLSTCISKKSCASGMNFTCSTEPALEGP